jgi:heme oxygenase
MATSLREAIHDLHHVAENTRFTKLLLSGDITPEAYSKFLQNLYPIYSNLESQATRHGLLKDIFDILRAESIHNDIKELNCLPVRVSNTMLTLELADEANVAMQFAIDLFEELADELHL